MPDDIEEHFDLDALNDEELTEQVHDDLYNGLKEEVEEATLEVLEGGTGKDGRGMILSVGGGTSPGMPRENILAMQTALDHFNASRTKML